MKIKLLSNLSTRLFFVNNSLAFIHSFPTHKIRNERYLRQNITSNYLWSIQNSSVFGYQSISGIDPITSFTTSTMFMAIILMKCSHRVVRRAVGPPHQYVTSTRFWGSGFWFSLNFLSNSQFRLNGNCEKVPSVTR